MAWFKKSIRKVAKNAPAIGNHMARLSFLDSLAQPRRDPSWPIAMQRPGGMGRLMPRISFGLQPDRLWGVSIRMTKQKKPDGKTMKDIAMERNGRRRQASPDWASGLRHLYDSVVEEPLPDSFSKLLEDLDRADG